MGVSALLRCGHCHERVRVTDLYVHAHTTPTACVTHAYAVRLLPWARSFALGRRQWPLRARIRIGRGARGHAHGVHAPMGVYIVRTPSFAPIDVFTSGGAWEGPSLRRGLALLPLRCAHACSEWAWCQQTSCERRDCCPLPSGHNYAPHSASVVSLPLLQSTRVYSKAIATRGAASHITHANTYASATRARVRLSARVVVYVRNVIALSARAA